MGVNLIGLRSLPGPPGASGLRVRPSGFSGCRGSRSTSHCQDLIVITYKYRGQSARMHKTGSKRYPTHNKAYSNAYIMILEELWNWFHIFRSSSWITVIFLRIKHFLKLINDYRKGKHTEVTRGSTRVCHVAWWCQHDVIMTSPGVSSADVSSGPYWCQRWPS